MSVCTQWGLGSVTDVGNLGGTNLGLRNESWSQNESTNNQNGTPNESRLRFGGFLGYRFLTAGHRFLTTGRRFLKNKRLGPPQGSPRDPVVGKFSGFGVSLEGQGVSLGPCCG